MHESRRLRLFLRPLSTVCKAEKTGFAGSLVFLVLFRNRAFSHPPPLRGSQRAVRGALCQGLKRGQPETSRRPLRGETKARGEEEQLCVMLRQG